MKLATNFCVDVDDDDDDDDDDVATWQITFPPFTVTSGFPGPAPVASTERQCIYLLDLV